MSARHLAAIGSVTAIEAIRVLALTGLVVQATPTLVFVPSLRGGPSGSRGAARRNSRVPIGTAIVGRPKGREDRDERDDEERTGGDATGTAGRQTQRMPVPELGREGVWQRTAGPGGGPWAGPGSGYGKTAAASRGTGASRADRNSASGKGSSRETLLVVRSGISFNSSRGWRSRSSRLGIAPSQQESAVMRSLSHLVGIVGVSLLVFACGDDGGSADSSGGASSGGAATGGVPATGATAPVGGIPTTGGVPITGGVGPRVAW
jgi:hypothetical protein